MRYDLLRKLFSVAIPLIFLVAVFQNCSVRKVDGLGSGGFGSFDGGGGDGGGDGNGDGNGGGNGTYRWDPAPFVIADEYTVSGSRSETREYTDGSCSLFDNKLIMVQNDESGNSKWVIGNLTFDPDEAREYVSTGPYAEDSDDFTFSLAVDQENFGIASEISTGQCSMTITNHAEPLLINLTCTGVGGQTGDLIDFEMYAECNPTF